MRPTHKNRSRNRHRSSGSSGGGGGNGGGNPLSRIYESNGPDVKVRGTAQTIAEKYLQLGRDAQSSSDIVMAESYFQHAEHYLRIVSAAQAYNQQNQPQQYRRPDEEFEDDDGEEGSEQASVEQRGGQNVPQGADMDGMGEQPMVQGDGERQSQPQQNTQNNYRQPREYRDASRIAIRAGTIARAATSQASPTSSASALTSRAGRIAATAIRSRAESRARTTRSGSTRRRARLFSRGWKNSRAWPSRWLLRRLPLLRQSPFRPKALRSGRRPPSCGGRLQHRLPNAKQNP
jgi:hypothetical protein